MLIRLELRLTELPFQLRPDGLTPITKVVALQLIVAIVPVHRVLRGRIFVRFFLIGLISPFKRYLFTRSA